MKPGIYQHYKGSLYKVTQVVKHSETDEELVLYQCQYDDFSWWVRPKAMFLENIKKDGKQIKRFTWLRDK
ncbi:MAG: DUF1653 domain-containing protein [Saccharospirillaceae bacterium]|nr:DUF1653 domain-containing protein [Pseudomonadales bacterium]NRB78480.1 DUF1653 domain-containing protein [Saccharospirillaceae bacterium]